jgi:hypothetical protein
MRPPPEELKAAVEALQRQQEAKEVVRKYQQGFGKPIISAEFQGYRLVAVSNRIKWSANWRWFTDFLLDHMKDSIGREWATKAQQRGLDHPIFRWLRRMNDLVPPRKPSGAQDIQYKEIGFLTSVFRLGYSLYLIDHHDQLDKRLISRLRVTREFPAAYYETIIAAAFATAGAKIRMAETGGTAARTPEFWATLRSGKRYAVEAKCKSRWKTDISVTSKAFQDELRQWLRDQVYRASGKGLQNAVYCFELAIPLPLDEAAWRVIHQLVKDALLEAEEITVKGHPAVPAYVLVTNNTHIANDDASGFSMVAMLEGFRLETFRNGAQVPIDTAFEWRDEHRDITWVVDCLAEIERVPSTFDGTPPEFVIAAREGRSHIKIGQMLEIAQPDGSKFVGILRDIVSHGAKAHVVMEGDEGNSFITEIGLNADEAAAAEHYGDAVFGKAKKRDKKREDILDLYDWFLEIYSQYDQAALLRQIPNHLEREQIASLPLAQMRVRVAREVTKAAFHHTLKSRAQSPVAESDK